VVTTETAGGQEVARLFPEDVRVTAVDSPDDLAAAVAFELGACRRVSRNVHPRLQTRFSIEACARNYHAIYRQVLAGRDQARVKGFNT